MLLWSGDYGLDWFNTWVLTNEQQKDLKEYWTRFEDHVKVQANHIFKRYYLRGLKQNNRPLSSHFRSKITHTEFWLPIWLTWPAHAWHTSFWHWLRRGKTKMHYLWQWFNLCKGKRNCSNRWGYPDVVKSNERHYNRKARRERSRCNKSKVNRPGNQSYQKYTGGRGNKRHDNPRQCYRFGDTPRTKGRQYPAIGVECFNWNKRGHLSKVYKSKTRSDVMTLWKKQPDDITSECSSYDKVFLEALELKPKTAPVP